MRFDYTKGAEARYMVSLHEELTYDCYYFGNYQSAKRFYDGAVAEARSAKRENLSISLTDIIKDVRKAFTKL